MKILILQFGLNLPRNTIFTYFLFIGYYGFIEHESGDYYFHVSNIHENSRKSKIKKGVKVHFDIFSPPNPEEGSSDEHNGKASNIEILSE